MDAEQYIAHYGSSLSESEKRYIRVFGAPDVLGAGASRNPYTPTLQVVDAPDSHAHGGQADRALHDRLDREVEADYGL